MASPLVDVSHGITIVFGTSGWTAEIVNVNGPSMSRDSLDISHQGSTAAKTFTPSDLYDAGELSLDVHFNPDTALLIDNAAETITITWPGTATYAFSGFATGFDVTGTHLDLLTATLTLKISGVITPTGA
ncbi:MAG TPA: phage tail tube protein [Phycisphaerae bacterium]|nr:phage tail tube protein [Phycisphaerae bacterium]